MESQKIQGKSEKELFGIGGGMQITDSDLTALENFILSGHDELMEFINSGPDLSHLLNDDNFLDDIATDYD